MQRAHRKAHALIWTSLAIALPFCLGVIFISASGLSPDAPSIRLAAPVQQGTAP
jgi:hypothetical protein